MKHKQSIKWHQDITDAVLDFKPVRLPTANTGQVAILWFPLNILQIHTDIYLGKKGKLKPDERDYRLKALIRGHTEKDVAIAACAHVLSGEAIREIIPLECRIDELKHTGFLPYLRAITSAHHTNPEAITPSEATIAQALILLSDTNSPIAGADLAIYFSTSSLSDPSPLFAAPFVDRILRKACTRFGEQLDLMKLDRGWKKAFDDASWLAGIPRDGPAIGSGAGHLLDRTFPAWRVWALWRPNARRLARWERFTGEERGELWDVLGLEGPDFETREKGTLREWLIARFDISSPSPTIAYGKVVARLENGDVDAWATVLDRLLDALDVAYSTSAGSLALFTYLCAAGTVNEKVFRLLELVNAIPDSCVSELVLRVLDGKPDAKISAMMELLPFLNDGPGRQLRDILTPDLIKSVDAEMKRKQDVFCEQLNRGGGDAMGMNILGFGEILKRATWLQPSLSDDVRSVLGTWPEKADLEPMFKLRKDVLNVSMDADCPLKNMFNTYFMACLAGRGEVNDEMRNTLDALVHFWQQPPERDRRAVALAIAQRPTISSELRIRCLTQLKDMSWDFVFEVNQMLKKDTDMACVNFASILASKPWDYETATGCWRGILLSMIRQQNTTLLDSSLKCLNIESWFQLLHNVKKIFGNSVRSDPPNILNPALHRWSSRLTQSYLPILTDLEKKLGSLARLKWILIGWEDEQNVILALNKAVSTR
jgi:hypothetical protein